MIADGSDDLLPLSNERCSPTVGQVVRASELGGVAPGAQLVDSLSDRNFTLCFIAQLLDLFAFLQHGGYAICQMTELHVVEGHLLRHAEEGNELAPMLLLEGFSRAKF